MSTTIVERHILVPDFVTAGPDEEGNWDGPSWGIQRLGLGVHTAWNRTEGAVMWIDALLYANHGGDLHPEDAEYLAAGLVEGARLVRSAR